MTDRYENEAMFWDQLYARIDPATINTSGATGSVYSKHGEALTSERYFHGLIDGLSGKAVACLGGGIDLVAIRLAGNDNRVTMIDLSNVALQHTRTLLQREGLEPTRIDYLHSAWEETAFDESFDVVVAHHSLHHMHFDRAIDRVEASLRPGGVFIAMEPVCRIGFVRLIHERFPFHPLPFIEGERELEAADLTLVNDRFEPVELSYYDALSRESITWSLAEKDRYDAIKRLSAMDAAILKWIPPWRYLATYVVIRAWKPR